MDYKMIRSKRKTLSLHITVDGLEVRAPLKMSQKKIDAFVASKSKWIDKNLNRMETMQKSKAAFSLGYGSFINIFGKDYTIAPSNDESDQRKILIDCNQVRIASKTLSTF